MIDNRVKAAVVAGKRSDARFDQEATDPLSSKSSAYVRSRLENLDIKACTLQSPRAAKPCESRSDHDDRRHAVIFPVLSHIARIV
jgi:hypothetical protein